MTSITNLLTKTRAAADQRRAAADDEYRKLVRKCADGAEISPEKILSQLDKWNRDVGEFPKDVEALAARIDLAAEAVAGVDRRTRVLTAESRMAEIGRALDAAIEKARVEAGALEEPVLVELAEAQKLAKRSEEASRKLMESAAPEKREAVRAANLRLNDARIRLNKARNVLANYPEVIARHESEVNAFREKSLAKHNPWHEEHVRKAHAELCAKDLKHAETNLTFAQSRQTEFEAEVRGAEVAYAEASRAMAAAEAALLQVE
jgi:hypothetical protein